MNKKKQLKIAKTLLKKSLTNGTLDSTKVQKILIMLASAKPQGLIVILKTYKRLIEAKLKSEEVIVETAIKLSSQKQLVSNLKKATGAKRIIYKQNPKIVFGAKITHGDWILDNTLESKLKQLTNL